MPQENGVPQIQVHRIEEIRDEIISNYLFANLLYPQMNLGLGFSTLPVVLKYLNEPTILFRYITDQEVGKIQYQMDVAHKHAGVNPGEIRESRNARLFRGSLAESLRLLIEISKKYFGQKISKNTFPKDIHLSHSSRVRAAKIIDDLLVSDKNFHNLISQYVGVLAGVARDQGIVELAKTRKKLLENYETIPNIGIIKSIALLFDPENRKKTYSDRNRIRERIREIQARTIELTTEMKDKAKKKIGQLNISKKEKKILESTTMDFRN